MGQAVILTKHSFSYKVMSPTQKSFYWDNSSTHQQTKNQSNCGWLKNSSSNNGIGCGWSNNNTTNTQNSGSEHLPKFSDTFFSSSENTAYKSVSRQNSDNHVFGDPRKKLDWDGLVDMFFVK